MLKLDSQCDYKNGIAMEERGLDVAVTESESKCYPLKLVTSFHCRIDRLKFKNTEFGFLK